MIHFVLNQLNHIESAVSYYRISYLFLLQSFRYIQNTSLFHFAAQRVVLLVMRSMDLKLDLGYGLLLENLSNCFLLSSRFLGQSE